MKYVISPVNTMTLEKGKKYPIIDLWENGFKIEEKHTKSSIDLFCLFKGCAHINGLDWIIEQEEN